MGWARSLEAETVRDEMTSINSQSMIGSYISVIFIIFLL